MGTFPRDNERARAEVLEKVPLLRDAVPSADDLGRHKIGKFHGFLLMILCDRTIDGHPLGREVCLVLGDDVLLRICAVVKIARDVPDRKPVLAVLAQRIVKKRSAVRLLFDRPAVC